MDDFVTLAAWEHITAPDQPKLYPKKEIVDLPLETNPEKHNGELPTVYWRKINQGEKMQKELIPMFDEKMAVLPTPLTLSEKKTVFDYRDSWEVLTQKDGDGGDSAYMTALASGLLLLDRDAFGADVLLDALERNCNVAKGWWVRHPNPDKWWSDMRNFSRDQADTVDWCMSVWQVLMGSFHTRRVQKEMWAARKARWFFHQNIHIGTDVPEGSDGLKTPDFTTPDSVSNLIRGQGWWYLYPLLVLCDLGQLFGLMTRSYSWDSDCMLARNIILAKIKYPTPVSWVVRKIYKRTNYLERIKNYFYKTGNSIEPLGDLYQKVCMKYID